jgi:adenylate cyclase
MNESLFTELSAWMTHAGLAGIPETDIVSGFCDRCVAAGIPLGRSHVFIDTLHPVYEGRLFRWGYSPNESSVHEYGRTRTVPYLWMNRRPICGDVAPSTTCCKLARRYCAAI